MNNPSRKIETREVQTAASPAPHLESSIIPSSFWLGGMKIDVTFDDTLAKSRSVIGEARYCKQDIALDPSVAPLQTVEQSFFHEMVHWILYMMSEDELRNNEKFVDLFAHFLYQARMTEQRQAADQATDVSDTIRGE